MANSNNLLEVYDKSVQDLVADLREVMKSEGLASYDSLIKVDRDGKAFTKSTIKDFTDASTCYYHNCRAFLAMPDSAVSGGAIQSNNRKLPPVLIVINGNDASAFSGFLIACNGQQQLKIEITDLCRANEAKNPLRSYVLERTVVVRTPTIHRVNANESVMIVVVQPQEVTITGYTYGSEGKKLGASATFKLDLATN